MKNLKTLFFALATGLFLFSCSKDGDTETDKRAPRKAAAMTEKQYIDYAADVLVQMLSENPQYITEIKNSINNEDYEYMEDRILFRDFFDLRASVTMDESAMRQNSQKIEKETDFQAVFEATCNAMKRIENNSENTTTVYKEIPPTITTADFINYLRNNDISIYCPYPYDLYEENTNTITIVSNTDITATSASGMQISFTGKRSPVTVDEAYTENYPVWFVQKENTCIFEKQNVRKNVWGLMQAEIMSISPKETVTSVTSSRHYEARISRVFCTRFCGLFEGDLELHFCSMSISPTYNPSTNTFSGSFDNLHPIRMPRKYVRYARKGKSEGWYPVNFIFDTDWETNRDQDFVAAYEYDNVQSKTASFEGTISGEYEGVKVSAAGKVGITYKSRDVLFGLKKWSRAWFFDIVQNSTDTWKDKNGKWKSTAPDGNRITWLGGEMALSVSLREYN